jgi:hypothetical protein
MLRSVFYPQSREHAVLRLVFCVQSGRENRDEVSVLCLKRTNYAEVSVS